MPLTSSQIVADALAIAKCPGFTAHGGRALNLVLNDLTMHRNLKVNLIAITVPIPAYSHGPFNLPANYLRTYNMLFGQDGSVYFLNPTEKNRYDAQLGTGDSPGTPYEWSSNLSAVAVGELGTFTIFPKSDRAITIQHRYFCSRPDISVPETNQLAPWFEDQDYLIHATALRMMRITDDSRYSLFEGDCTRMLQNHLFTEGDEQEVLKTIALDPLRFKMGNRLRSTKADPW